MKSIFYPWAFYFPASLRMRWSSYLIAASLTGGMGFAGSATAMLMASSIDSQAMATTTFAVITLVAQNLCGFYIDITIIPDWISWISYLSVYRYAYQAFLKTQIDQAATSVFSSARTVAFVFGLSFMVYGESVHSHTMAISLFHDHASH